MSIEPSPELCKEIAKYIGKEDSESIRDFLENNYEGKWDNELNFSEYLFDKVYLKEFKFSLYPYIDYDAFKRDIFIDDYISFEANNKTHVFKRV